MIRVFVEAACNELFERSREFPLQSWGVIFGNEEKCPHRVQGSVGGFSLSQLNCRDSKRPDISLKIKEKCSFVTNYRQVQEHPYKVNYG